jgi:ubiquinone/menaquinone biosynthesis C-methylase UbiE
MEVEKVWQLEVAKKSLKKQSKLRAIDTFFEPTSGKKCLEIGCDTGVTSYFLRKRGGDWISLDGDKEKVEIARKLIGDTVFLTDGRSLNFADATFDCVAIIDFLEHIETDQEFIKEVYRVLKPSGSLYVTVPHTRGGKDLILNRLRWWLGFKPSDYGHVRKGYSLEDLRTKLEKGGFKVTGHTTFSRFFSEFIELVANYTYMFILNKGQNKGGLKGGIAPSSQKDLRQHHKSFKLYSLAYPVLWVISQLDELISFTPGYILMVSAKKA